MSNVYNHRQMVPAAPLSSRVTELLEALRTEYDALNQEASTMKIYKDEYEQRINSQINEMQAFQQNLYELERTFQKSKQQYEEEIHRLRRELEARGGPPAPPGPFFQQPQQQPPGGPQQPMPPQVQQQQGMPVNQQPHSTGIPPGSQPPPPPQGQPHVSQGPGMFGGMPPSTVPPHSGPNGAAMAPGQPPMGGEMHPGVYAMGPGGQPGLYPPGGAMPMASHGQPATPQQQAAALNKDRKPSVMTPTQAGGPPPGMPGARQTPTQSQQQQAQQQQQQAQQQQAQQQRSMAVVPKQGMVSNSQLADIDPDNVPPHMKREGSDWFVIFNPKLTRSLNIEHVCTLDHSSVVCCVKFSNDGKLLATGCNRTTQIWNVETGIKESSLADESAPKNGDLYIRAVCFSPDGKYLVTGAEDKQIRIWDVQKKTIRHVLSGHDQDIYSLDFSPDGRTILSGSGDRTVRLWDLETGKNIHTFSIDDMGPKDAGVTSVAFSPNGQLVAAASLDKMIRLWDASSGQFLERIDGHKDSVYAVAFSPDGQSLLSGSLDKTLRIWDLARLGPNGRPTGPSVCRSTLSGHKDFVLSVAYSPDGAWIVSGSKDRGVQFWDPRTSQTQCMLQGHKNSVISVALSPTQPLFATGSGDCRARIWSYENLQNTIPPSV